MNCLVRSCFQLSWWQMSKIIFFRPDRRKKNGETHQFFENRATCKKKNKTCKATGWKWESAELCGASWLMTSSQHTNVTPEKADPVRCAVLCTAIVFLCPSHVILSVHLPHMEQCRALKFMRFSSGEQMLRLHQSCPCWNPKRMPNWTVLHPQDVSSSRGQ